MSENPAPHVALSIEKLFKQYRSGTVAVDHIDLEVAQGAFFGLLGPNGAGKTTTISCITGISFPTSGTIKVFGHDAVSEYKLARKQIGLSPQEFNVDIFATTRKILDYVGSYYGMPKKDREERIEELLERFNLKQYEHTDFHSLSGGYKRRVMLARALIHDPGLLILDEPTAGVDVNLRHELWKYLQDLNAAGKTIILTSHYLEEVERLCNDIAVINRGQVVARGTKEDFLKGGRRLEEVYLELTDAKKEHDIE